MRPMVGRSGAAAREPRWNRLDADERRTQILDCARRLFTERPYATVSMTEIAACAGVRRGLLHHYFGGKHELYLAVVRDLLARFGEIVPPEGAPATGSVPGTGSVPATGGPPAPGGDHAVASLDDLVATYVDRWLDLVGQQADSWFALIDAEAGHRDPEVVRLVQRARGAMVDGIVTALGLTGTDPHLRVVLNSYAGLAEVATREWLKRGTIDRPQVHALLTTTMTVMLREVVPAVAAVSSPGGRRRPSTARAARA